MSDALGRRRYDRARARHLPASVGLAKISIPREAVGVARPRLFTALDRARQRPAIWISAPGGAGKTTLAATYIAARKLPYLWYQLDDDDADPAAFFCFLGEAFKRHTADPAQQMPLLTPDLRGDVPGFARRYFRELFGRLAPGAVMVLDDYRDGGALSALNGVIGAAIGELPREINLMVLSRSEPPVELARPRMTGAVVHIDAQELRLTPTETSAIAERLTNAPSATVRVLHDRCDGWVAGLILLLEQARRDGGVVMTSGAGAPRLLFDYFAAEFFERLSTDTQTFLLETALPSYLTPGLAACISANPTAEAILATLHRQHLFTTRRTEPVPAYQYHALFREFLLARLAQTRARADYDALMMRTGRALAQDGRHDEAVGLYLGCRAWREAAALIMALAPTLLSQGRVRTVAGWIERIPAEEVDASAWLLFWRGICQQADVPPAAQATLIRAFDVFDGQGDETGRIVSSAAMVEGALTFGASLRPARRWLAALLEALHRAPSFPSATLEAGVLTTVVRALLQMRPDDPQLARHARRAAALLEADIGVNQGIRTAASLLQYYGHAGDLDACDRLLQDMGPIADNPEVSPCNRAVWHLMAALPHMLRGRGDQALKAMAVAHALTRDHNLRSLQPAVAFHGTLAHLNAGDEAAARALIKRIGALCKSEAPMDRALTLTVGVYGAVIRGDAISLWEQALPVLADLCNAGAGAAATELSCVLALAQVQAGRPEDALVCLAVPQSARFSNSRRLRLLGALVEADARLRLGESHRGHRLLADALALGRAQGFFGVAYWSPALMGRLCGEALQAGIETAYVKDLIRHRDLVPHDPTIDEWPWPLRIYTLGQFHLERDGKPLTLEGKKQRKPLELLEVLVALGGYGVREEKISSILWPDAEGDAAYSAFTTTLSRLRKIVGDQVVMVQNGRVSLDHRRCWIDVWAFKRQIEHIDRSGEDAAGTGSDVERLMTLYRGPFLVDRDDTWVRGPRECLRLKFARHLMQTGRALSAVNRHEHAMRLFHRGIEIDPYSEELYRGLMGCYKSLDRNNEAVAAYHRCRDMLDSAFGLRPSPKTEKLLAGVASRLGSARRGQATGTQAPTDSAA